MNKVINLSKKLKAIISQSIGATKLIRWAKCHLLDKHVWTTDAMQGRKLRVPLSNFEKSFREHTRARCRHCEYASKQFVTA